MTRKIIAAVLIAVTVATAAQAAEAGQEPPQSIAVTYADLDLRTEAGRSDLTIRVEAAAAQLCSPVLPGRNYRGSEEGIRFLKSVYSACIGRLRDRAMAKVQISRK